MNKLIIILSFIFIFIGCCGDSDGKSDCTEIDHDYLREFHCAEIAPEPDRSCDVWGEEWNQFTRDCRVIRCYPNSNTCVGGCKVQQLDGYSVVHCSKKGYSDDISHSGNQQEQSSL